MAAAGPLCLVVGFAQAFLRPGFDAAHNDLSVLANGDPGWIQVAKFVLGNVHESRPDRPHMHPARGPLPTH
ncbi:DUF998 domain-containing protein [Glaciibacter sp. 2TAF33]|uniref:DUF998 domain-containing protein n=1 Tax=Glaciibacter sp. 2TAF33 TaxID=3233015 RepID=UPI003F92086C